MLVVHNKAAPAIFILIVTISENNSFSLMVTTGAQFLWLSFLENSPQSPGAVVFRTIMIRLITLADDNQVHLEYLVTLNSN